MERTEQRETQSTPKFQIRSLNSNTWNTLTKEQVMEATKRAICMYSKQDMVAL